MLRGFVHDHPLDWPEYLAQVEMYYNATPHSSTGKSPHYIVFGREAQLPADLIADVPLQAKSFVDIWSEAKRAVDTT